MEHVRSLGGDPFTLVSEMPLFLRPPLAREIGPAGEGELRAALAGIAALAARDPAAARAEAARRGLAGMPLRDQMRLQLAFLDEALARLDPPQGV
jgi:hypothetical protein